MRSHLYAIQQKTEKWVSRWCEKEILLGTQSKTLYFSLLGLGINLGTALQDYTLGWYIKTISGYMYPIKPGLAIASK